MIGLSSTVINNLTRIITFGHKTTRQVASFNHRIRNYGKRLDRYERQFHMRAPDLATKNILTFPIKIPFLLRHRYRPNRGGEFIDNSTKIHWNRLTPNEILLAFESIEYLEYNEMMEGLKYLSEVRGQEAQDWNSHPWIIKAMDEVNANFFRIKKKDRLSVYYLMKKLRYGNDDFWKKMYSVIEENIYELYPSEFETFFMRYYKVSEQHFSLEMKDKFLTLLEGRLRSFSPEGIIKIYELYQEEDRLDAYWKENVFIPMFKNQQYTFTPTDLRKIIRFMLVLGHEKDERLYASLYTRLTGYSELSEDEIDQLEEVILEVKDIFISHRVDPYLAHLKDMRKKMKVLNASRKKEIPIHELVRQDLVFVMHKRKIKSQNQPSEPKNEDFTKLEADKPVQTAPSVAQ